MHSRMRGMSVELAASLRSDGQIERAKTDFVLVHFIYEYLMAQ